MKKIYRIIFLNFVIWTAYNFLNAGILSIQQKLPYLDAWQGAAVQNYIMALLSIPLWYFCRKYPFNKSRIIPFFGTHLLTSIFFSTVWVTLTYLINWLWMGEMIVKFMLNMGIHYWQFLDGLTRYGFLAGLFYTINFYKKFKEKELKEAELSYLTKNMELQNLKSQINPHFLFNALNSVSALMAREPEKARTMNAKLAQLLRFSLDGYEKKFVSLKHELDFIHDYLDIEKVRFGNKLQVNEEVDPRALATKVPSMLLQPIVENAIKHGISNQAKGGELTIHVFHENGLLNIEISNTGKTVSEEILTTLFDKGIGLKNTNERLKRTYGESFGLELKKLHPSGFLVKIRIPLKQEAK